ncbi:hypothetical protein MmiHf6_08120 [Methanimicrococcus hongohii]|uniref:Uncharacterized protein n=1 Tax=Methanimicrococcus hongohii TaxID=3028295 RepID=A0AA96V1C8_9EURY|nr:hypothetical protein MmiHf6_08120 [Methanimicrococcus sp. Hf6]
MYQNFDRVSLAAAAYKISRREEGGVCKKSLRDFSGFAGLQLEGGVCFRLEGGVCFRLEGGVCFRLEGGVCFRLEGGVCFRLEGGIY